MRSLCLMLVLAGGGWCLPAAAQNDSAYSAIELSACRDFLDGLVPESQVEIWDRVGAYRKVCPGFGGHDVHLVWGDVMIAVGFAPTGVNDAVFPPEVFAAYTTVNLSAVEWRMREGTPIAAIQRWYLDLTDGTTDGLLKGEVLVVSKLAADGPFASCFAGYVDAKANADANEVARKVADTIAPEFACGTDTPRYHGELGPTAAERLVLN